MLNIENLNWIKNERLYPRSYSVDLDKHYVFVGKNNSCIYIDQNLATTNWYVDFTGDFTILENFYFKMFRSACSASFDVAKEQVAKCINAFIEQAQKMQEALPDDLVCLLLAADSPIV